MKNIIEFGEGITYLNEVTEYKLNGILIKDKFSLPNGIWRITERRLYAVPE